VLASAESINNSQTYLMPVRIAKAASLRMPHDFAIGVPTQSPRKTTKKWPVGQAMRLAVVDS
jgi:hypothetical protein